MSLPVLTLYDGKSRVNMLDVLMAALPLLLIEDSIQVEENRIKFRNKSNTAGIIPSERRQLIAIIVDVSHVPCEWRHVMGGIGEFENRCFDDFRSGLWTEFHLETLYRNYGQLLNDEPVQILTVNLLPCQKVERHGIQIGQ